jgi:hypothetical protein
MHSHTQLLLERQRELDLRKNKHKYKRQLEKFRGKFAKVCMCV